MKLRRRARAVVATALGLGIAGLMLVLVELQRAVAEIEDTERRERAAEELRHGAR